MKALNRTAHSLFEGLASSRIKRMTHELMVGDGSVPRLERERWVRLPRSAIWAAFAEFSSKEVLRPGFLLGCGRSGSTIFGETLGMHPDVAYLNEPRHIWTYESRTDVWSTRAEERGGNLALGAEDVTREVEARVDRAFRAQLAIRGRSRLIEKLPENCFRMGFIRAIFPDGRFIHLIRHGYAVARSIAKLAEADLWYGEADYKWEMLEKLCRDTGEIQALELAEDPFVRGLIEWKLSIASAREYAKLLPRTDYMEIRFEDLVQNPVRTTRDALSFLDLDSHPTVDRAALRLHPVSMPTPSSKDIGLVEAVTGDLMVALGYEIEKPNV